MHAGVLKCQLQDGSNDKKGLVQGQEPGKVWSKTLIMEPQVLLMTDHSPGSRIQSSMGSLLGVTSF